MQKFLFWSKPDPFSPALLAWPPNQKMTFFSLSWLLLLNSILTHQTLSSHVRTFHRKSLSSWQFKPKVYIQLAVLKLYWQIWIWNLWIVAPRVTVHSDLTDLLVAACEAQQCASPIPAIWIPPFSLRKATKAYTTNAITLIQGPTVEVVGEAYS